VVFSSISFVVFFACYFAIHLLLPTRLQVPLIIVGSTIFYGAWNPYYVWVPYLLLGIAYFGGFVVAPEHRTRRGWRLALVLTTLLLPLIFFKYTNFIYGQVIGPLFGLRGRLLDVSLPLGISFVTFTMMAYVIEVSRSRYPLERHPGRLAALVLFFPHLIAGPILRPWELMPQLNRTDRVHRALQRRLIVGFVLFTVGLVKKVIFADQVGAYVDAIYNSHAGLMQAEYLLAILAFSVQIYCDFSGYTDMAIGTAIILGYRLPRNFWRPYAATSIIDFWRRWHMTLSSWLRDYLYIPLGGNRHGLARRTVNVLITMGLGGLWHGASWTFVLWGLMHGIAIGMSHAMEQLKISLRLPRRLAALGTFIFVTIAWVLFRARDLTTAKAIFIGAVAGGQNRWAEFSNQGGFIIFLVAVFFLLHRWDDHRQIRSFVARAPRGVLWPLLAAGWIAAITISQGSSAKFIYFDF
jgi:alginate O-acetyltransferase complex protein AlgI